MPVRSLVCSALLLCLFATTAAGHAEIDAASFAPGTRGTVTIHIPHGCSSETGAVADTTRVSALVPRGFTAVRPRSPRGWTVRLTTMGQGQRVEWTRTVKRSGVLDFTLSVRFPTRVGTFALPTVQYCGKRSVAWIERSVAGEEPDHPAPLVVVG